METSQVYDSYTDVDVKRKGIFSDWRLWFAIAVVTAAVLRFYQLGTESLWIDEGFSLRDATRPFTFAKASKPFFYWLLTPWVKLGTEDWFLRLPAVIFGIASVALVFVLGRMIWGTKAGFLGAMLVAVSPLHVNHSQEVRMYTLLTLTTLASVYFLLVALRTWQFRHMAACALFGWMAILTQPMSCLLLVVENLVVLDAYIRRKRPLTPWFVTQVAIVVAWLPWLQYVLGFNSFFENSWASLIDKASASDMPRVWSEFGVGDWHAKYSELPMRVILYAYTYISLITIVAFGWMDRRRPETRLVLAWFLVPGLALLALSTTKLNALIPRYLVFTAPAFLMLLGAAWARVSNRALFAALGIILLVIPTLKLVRYYEKPMRPEWRHAVQYITENQRPTDFIGVYRYGNRWVFDHYYHGQAKWSHLGPENYLRSQMLGWNENKALDLIDEMPDAPRRWLVVSRLPYSAEHAIDYAIKKHYRVIQEKHYTQLKVYLFDEVKDE